MLQHAEVEVGHGGCNADSHLGCGHELSRYALRLNELLNAPFSEKYLYMKILDVQVCCKPVE